MFTREELEVKTVPELREMCVYNLGIPGMTKKRKEIIIDAILQHQQEENTDPVGIEPNRGNDSVTAIEFEMSSHLTKPNARKGDKTTSTIMVACGANQGEFDVVGKSVGAVSEFLREVLNIDRMSSGVVNGKTVDDGYILKAGDHLEYLKPAGRKG